MKRWVEIVCFAYGCVGAAITLLWCCSAVIGRNWIPDRANVIVTLFGIHMSVLGVTFWRAPAPAFWRPIIAVSPSSVLRARAGLALLLVVQLIMWGYVLWFAGARQNIFLLVGSLVLFSMAYIAAHWAIRPENLFSKRVLLFAENPLLSPFLYLVSKKYRGSYRLLK